MKIIGIDPGKTTGYDDLIRYKTVIGIDGGKSGAVAVARNGELKVYKMPQSNMEMRDFFERFQDEEVYCFLEKVSAFIGENDVKKYAIIKMLNQVQTIKTTLEQLDIDYVEIASVTWQSKLKLRFKGMDKAKRKQMYYEFAKKYAYQTKVSKYQADAVCVLACGFKLIAEKDPLVSFERMKQTDLF